MAHRRAKHQTRAALDNTRPVWTRASGNRERAGRADAARPGILSEHWKDSNNRAARREALSHKRGERNNSSTADAPECDAFRRVLLESRSPANREEQCEDGTRDGPWQNPADSGPDNHRQSREA